jgi:hypothetical protein
MRAWAAPTISEQVDQYSEPCVATGIHTHLALPQGKQGRINAWRVNRPGTKYTSKGHEWQACRVLYVLCFFFDILHQVCVPSKKKNKEKNKTKRGHV